MDFRDIKEFFKDSFKFIIIIVVVLVINLYIFTLQQVVGPSMNFTLENNNIVILDRVTYKISDIKREDIVALNDTNSKFLIQRVIGLPGEHIYFIDNTLYINDVKREEPYLGKDTITHDFKLENLGHNKIPEDMYLVLGDNRTNSLDSRDPKVGLVSKKDIIGKVRLRVWPINKFKIVK